MGTAVETPLRARILPERRWIFAMALAAVLTVPAALTAYYRAFMEIRGYDDEGAMIEMTRRFLAGQPLYDSVHSIYGPVFFLYQSIAHGLAGSPMTTDSVRFVSVAVWICAAILVFVLAYRTSQSWLLAAAAYVVAFRVLYFIGDDPGHPQEMCLLLALALVVAACYTERPTRAMFWTGALAGAMTMTKINAGAIAVLAIVVALTSAMRWTAVRTAAIGIAAAFPWLLMGPLLSMTWTQRYFAIEELSLAALAITLARAKFETETGPREAALAAAGFLAAIVVTALFAILRGSTPGAMLEWMIVKPRQLIGPMWFLAPKIGSLKVVWAGVGVASAATAQTRLVRPWMLASAKLALGLGTAGLIVIHRPNDLMTLVPPFLWLLAMPEDEAARARLSMFSRTVMAASGVTMMLYAYPVAGAQVKLVAAFLTALAAVAFSDGAWWAAVRLGEWKLWARRIAYAAAVVMLVRFCVSMPLSANRYYAAVPALGIPGAKRLHLGADDVAGLRQIADTARRSCGLLLTAPGMPTFNLWTGVPNAPSLGGGNWVTGMSDAEQQRVVHQIEGEAKLCAVLNEDMIAMWTHGADVSRRPLIRFIHENLQPVAEGRGNVLLVRR